MYNICTANWAAYMHISWLPVQQVTHASTRACCAYIYMHARHKHAHSKPEALWQPVC